MTNERIAIEALARCTFLPGSFDKRFANSLAAKPEDFTLSVKQRQTLWKIVNKYRKRMPRTVCVFLDLRLMIDPVACAFEDILDTDPTDDMTRLIYADWLDEHVNSTLANGLRWIVEHKAYPRLVACGQSYGPNGTTPINFEWTFGMDVWAKFPKTMLESAQYLPYYHRSRADAESALSASLASLKRKQLEAV